MASIPFSTSDPVEQIELERDGHWLTATLTISGEMIISDEHGEIHRYLYIGRRGDLPAVIDSVEHAVSTLIWQHGPIDQWIRKDINQ